MLADEIKTVLGLKGRLEERVIGQSHALDTIAQRIRTPRANLTDPRRPIGVFLLVGPSGVGKTETALARSPQRGPHPYPDAASRDVAGIPHAHGIGPEHCPGARVG